MDTLRRVGASIAASLSTLTLDDAAAAQVTVKRVDILPATPTVYPQVHLLGLPQELQDRIFKEVFRPSTIEGSAKLRPLLTCRHIYHVANKTAWANTTFNITHVADDRIEAFLSAVRPEVTKRKILSLEINLEQVEPIILAGRVDPAKPGFFEKLPDMTVLNMINESTLISVDESGHPTAAAAKALLDRAHHLMASCGLSTKATVFMATPAIFEENSAHCMGFLCQMWHTGAVPNACRCMDGKALLIHQYPGTQATPEHLYFECAQGEVTLMKHWIFSNEDFARDKFIDEEMYREFITK